MLRIRYRPSLGQTTAGAEPLVMPPADPFVVPSSPAVPIAPPSAQQPVPVQQPSAPAPAPIAPGLPAPVTNIADKIKALTESPFGKAMAIGSITAVVAKTFPKKFFVPFFAGVVLSILTGVVPEPTNENLRQILPFKRNPTT